MSAPRPRPVPARLLERALAAPDSPLCVVPERVLDGGLPVDGQIGWWRVTVGEAALQVAALADALETAGVVASDRVGVLAGSSHTWAVLDLAIQALGAITVGLSPELGVEELRRRLALTGARLLVTDRTVAIPGVTRLGMPGTPGTPLQPGTAPDLDRLAARLSAIDVDQPAALAFTAGTTAPARAATLSHNALYQAVVAGRNAFDTKAGDRSVVALPMDHIHQRFATYAGTDQGIEGWYPRHTGHLPDTFRAARPHLLVASPAVLEDIRLAARARAVERGFGGLFDWACQPREQRRGWRARAEREIADHMVFRRIRRGLGGHLRSIVAGGAPLSVALAGWFARVGIPVRDGWGLVETGAPLTASTGPGEGVGRPLPGVRVRVADSGELEVDAPSVMSGYHGDPAATARAFTPDGWLRTGDWGWVDRNGQVHLGGRLSDRLPGPEVLDLGEVDGRLSVPGGRWVVTCPARAAVGLVAFSFRPRSGDSVSSQNSLRQAILNWNHARGTGQRIVKLACIDATPTVTDGTCTPTLAPVREAIYDRYHGLLETF